MSIWDRLGNVINAYMNDFSARTPDWTNISNANRNFRSSNDPDLDAAYDELNDFLNERNHRFEGRRQENHSSGSHRSGAARSNDPNLPPEELRLDFEKLGVHFGADEETCKNAYKKLMKIHHPDRHAGHENNFKKATERSARINASWDRISIWHQGRQQG